MVKLATAWLMVCGNRRLPYRGPQANDRWLHHRAAALNLRYLVNLELTAQPTLGLSPLPPDRWWTG
ncbi:MULTISPECIES: hypothetical protein [unclassified Nonomuraea]|uniref:hypothetical protein n=1 Tax=unclassified Nonomuraea TaxID=2593643 RepID=UPI0033F0EE02